MRTLKVSRKAAALFMVMTVVLGLSISLPAQTLTSIQGTITDEQGRSVVGANVRLNSRTGLKLQATTSPEGIFGFGNLTGGVYLIEVNAPGFSALTSEEIDLQRGETKSIRFQLKVAAINAGVVVIATGTPQGGDEVAKVVSVIDSQQIENRHELNVAETLRGVPGVRVQQQGSPGALTTVRVRGQRSFDTAVLFDGMRVRDAADINGSAASLVADLVPISVDRIEVLRGSGSSIYGTNAIGGAVNIVPVTAAGGLRFEAGVEAGGLSTFRERLRFARGAKHFGFAFGINRTDVRKGLDGNDQYGNSAASGRFEFNPTSDLTISANFFGTVANARLNDPPFALAAAFTSPQLYPTAVVGLNYQPDFNNPDQGRRNRLLLGSAKLTHQLNDSFSYALAYQRLSSKRRNYNGPRIDARFAAFYPFGDIEFLNGNRATTDTLEGRLNMELGRVHLATAGFEFETESMFQESIPSFSAFNRTTDGQRTFALFGQDQLSLLDNRLRLAVGIRTQSYRVRSTDRPGSLQNIGTKRSLVADGAIAYFFRSTKTKFRAHVGNGFRAPALFERFGEGVFPGIGLTRFGDPTLKAEQSVSVDGGIDQRLAGDRLQLSATYFYTRLQRAIVFTNFAADPLGLGRFSGYTNQSGGLSRGAEFFLETTPARATSIRASYSFTNSDRSALAKGLQREFVIPRHLLSLILSQRYRQLTMSLDFNRTGSYIAPIFENNFPFRPAVLRFSAYTKVDLFASFERRISERVTAVLFGGADNLFDRKYFENGFRAPGIVARGGVNFKF